MLHVTNSVPPTIVEKSLAETLQEIYGGKLSCKISEITKSSPNGMEFRLTVTDDAVNIREF